MGFSDNYFFVEVTGRVIVHAEEPFTLYQLGSACATFRCWFFLLLQETLKWQFLQQAKHTQSFLISCSCTSYPLAGEIRWNAAAGENQIRCNNRGIDFVEALADVELKELNLYNPDESIEGKLLPKKLHGLLATQVTELKCGGIVIGCMFDPRATDGYSANMFISSWADIARSETPSMIPSFQRSILNPRCPITYSPSVNGVFALYEPPTKPNHDGDDINGDHVLISRIYYIEGDQLSKLQLLASENGRSKLEAFTSFLWKIVAFSMDESGNHNKMCNMVLAVDGRTRLSQGDGEEKKTLMTSHIGNVLSMPYGSKRSQELKEMSLSNIATEVHEFLQNATTKDHFLDLIDWVEERRSQPLIAKAFAGNEMSVLVSSGTLFHIMDKMDFGWGKVVFGSCHLPSCRNDCYVMTLASPTNSNDWVVYMHLPMKQMNYIESHAGHMLKPLNSNYLQI